MTTAPPIADSLSRSHSALPAILDVLRELDEGLALLRRLRDAPTSQFSAVVREWITFERVLTHRNHRYDGHGIESCSPAWVEGREMAAEQERRWPACPRRTALTAIERHIDPKLAADIKALFHATCFNPGYSATPENFNVRLDPNRNLTHQIPWWSKRATILRAELAARDLIPLAPMPVPTDSPPPVGRHECPPPSPLASPADPPPPTAEITPDELAFWARPSGERIAALSCVEELIDQHAVDAEFRRLVRADSEYTAMTGRIGFDLTADIHEEFIRLGETEGLQFSSQDYQRLADVRRRARRVLLSRLRRSWSIGWLHERCGRYLATFDWLEGALRGGPIGPVILAGRIDRTDDFAALWDIARDAGGARPLPPRPARTTGLNQHEVRTEVERLMSWCAENMPPPAPPLPVFPFPAANGTAAGKGNPPSAGAKPKKRAGRKPADPVLTKRIRDAWNTDRYRTADELARELHIDPAEVRRALDRSRKKSKP